MDPNFVFEETTKKSEFFRFDPDIHTMLTHDESMG